MEKKNLTRKNFLTNTSKYAVGAAMGVAGLNALAGGKIIAKASPKQEWPWNYQELDPEVVRVKAHTLYYNDMDCCSGVFGALLTELQEKVGEPWTNIPMEVMLFGRGGGVGWGTICGTLNGGAALISIATDKASSGPLVNELWGWYTQEQMPTNAANAATYVEKKFEGAVTQNVSGSPLCHSSVSQWCLAAEKGVGDAERKERCARVAGDVAAKTAEILNAHFANSFTSTYTDPDSVKTCLSCHGSAGAFNVLTKMECEPCHTTAHPSDIVETNPGTPEKFTIEQNYPNPFNPTTNIKFSVPQAEKVSLEVYDIQGRLVDRIIDHQEYNPGNYQTKWNGTDGAGTKVASGVYFARLIAGTYMQTIKMNLVK